MSSQPWRGVYPAITTKFHADESIDAAGTAKHIEFLIKNGVHGLVTTGSLGEASTLTLEEKLDMLSGMNFTSTNGIPRVGIPPLKVRVLFQPLVFPSLTQYFRLWIL